MKAIRTWSAALGAGCALWAATAGADGEPAAARRLSGDYGMTFSQTCVLTPFGAPPASGFDPATGALLQDAEIISSVSSGVMRFRRSGAATIENGLLTEIQNARVNVGDVPAMARVPYTCTGSYQRNGSVLAVDLACNPPAPQPSLSVTIQPFRLSGFVSADEATLVLAAVDGNVQSVEVAAGGQVVQRRERICIQSLSLARLQKETPR